MSTSCLDCKGGGKCLEFNFPGFKEVSWIRGTVTSSYCILALKKKIYVYWWWDPVQTQIYETKTEALWNVQYFLVFFCFMCSISVKNCWSWSNKLFSWPVNRLWLQFEKNIVVCSKDSQETDFISNSILLLKAWWWHCQRNPEWCNYNNLYIY